MTTQRIIPGDCIAGLRTLPDASVHCCVTSPPYWGLRDYGHDGQIGLESTPEAYVARMVEVFREVRRVLRDDGTLWLNLGDSYCSQGGERKYGSSDGVTGRGDAPGARLKDVGGFGDGTWDWIESNPTEDWATDEWLQELKRRRAAFLKPKDLVGIPWRVAFALQADGWWLRQDIIWHKPNPMPESVTDRCTKAHEYVFLLTKSERYYYDAAEIAEKAKDPDGFKYEGGWEEMRKHVEPSLRVQAGNCRTENGTVPHFAAGHGDKRNRRSVWTVTTKPYSGAHFAVMPPDLVEPCIKAGCPEGGTVIDPFAGSGTTLAVAAELGRNGIGCELNPEYIALAERRIKDARSSVALFEGAVA
jgi:DNA modification methylase